MIPKRPDHLPAIAVIRRAEETARNGSAPDHAGLVETAGLERPNAYRAPRERPAPHVVLLVAFRLGRIRGRRDLLPTRRCRAVQLDAEMAVIESGIMPPVARGG